MPAEEQVPSKFTGWAAKDRDHANVLEKWSYDPKPFTDDDVDVRITHCGVCGSDLHTLRSGWMPTIYPVVVGHEIAGHVVRVGRNVTKFKVGDAVGVGAACYSCLKCKDCKEHHENNCPWCVETYNAKYSDGSIAYGGYSNYIRVHQHWAFRIPTGMKNEEAACLFCAGITTYTPFIEYKIGKGHRVGVVGIGGLGHLGIQWAAALGANVTAISHSYDKREDAKKLGAHQFVNMNNLEELKKDERSLDFILCTSDSDKMPWEAYFNLLDSNGIFCLLGIPDKPLSGIPPLAMIKKNLKFSGSVIGPPHLTENMLEFANKHGVKVWYEKRPMNQVNQTVEDMGNGKARYRYVLEN